MTEAPDHEPQHAADRPALTRDDARLIAREVLAELSDNFVKYVGRGIVHAMGKGFLLLIMALALYGWAHMGTWQQPAPRTLNH